jgi:hypothetical protein
MCSYRLQYPHDSSNSRAWSNINGDCSSYQASLSGLGSSKLSTASVGPDKSHLVGVCSNIHHREHTSTRTHPYRAALTSKKSHLTATPPKRAGGRSLKPGIRRLLVCCDTCSSRHVNEASPDTIKWRGAQEVAALVATLGGIGMGAMHFSISCFRNSGEDAACDMCSGPLRRPMRESIVTGFLCHACGVILPGVPSLCSHSEKHTGVQPFFCPMCPRNFSRRECLFSHLAACHPESQK